MRCLLCRYCKKEFKTLKLGRIVHCPECMLLYVTRHLECKHCGKAYIQVIPAKWIKCKKPSRFCSRSCKNRWEHANGVRHCSCNDELAYDRWLRKYGKEEADRRLVLKSAKQSASMTGDNNGRWGKNKHTPLEIADQKRKLLENPNSLCNNLRGKKLEDIYGAVKAARIRANLSIATSGANNPMYGKPSSKKAGIGWKGYYKCRFFRSLLELAFMLKFEDYGLQTAETAEYSVEYTLHGIKRTYCPDFVDKNGTVYEVKPSSLANTSENKAKFSAAEARFSRFVVVTEHELDLITMPQLAELVKSDKVSFTPKTSEKIATFMTSRGIDLPAFH